MNRITRIAGLCLGFLLLAGFQTGPNNHIPIRSADATQRVMPSEIVISVSQGGRIIAAMPEMSYENTFQIIDTEAKTQTEYRSTTLMFHNISVAADGRSFAVLASDGRRHGLNLMQCEVGGACATVARFDRQIVTSIASSPDGSAIWYTVLAVDGFAENPENFIAFNAFEASSFPGYLGGDRMHHANDIYRLSVATGASALLYPRVKVAERIHAAEGAVVFNGFSDAGMADLYEKADGNIYSPSAITWRGIPMICGGGEPCKPLDLVPDVQEYPAVIAGASPSGGISLRMRVDSSGTPAANGQDRSFTVHSSEGVTYDIFERLPQADDSVFDVTGKALYVLTNKAHLNRATTWKSPSRTRAKTDLVIVRAHNRDWEVLDFRDYKPDVRVVD